MKPGSQQLKVAHVTTIDMALRYLLLNQLRNLQEAGYEVTGISTPGSDVQIIEAAGIRHIAVTMPRSPYTPIQDLSALKKLYFIFRRERFSIVHTHNPKPGVLGQLAAKLAGVPVIINTVHGFYFHEHMPVPLRRFYVGLEKATARCSDVILSQNREDIDTAVREKICHPEKIKCLGNGIDLHKFDRATVPLESITAKRNEVELAAETRVIGFVGRLVREKGLLELFEAVRAVRQKVPNVTLLIIGPHDTNRKAAITAHTARKFGIREIARFLGTRHDMPEWYALMDVLVLPSYREGFPRVCMEASAMGVPCVATDIRGCREAVEHGRNGLLVPVADVPALADAIIEVLTSHEKAQCFGREGRCMAEDRFDERQVFEKVKAEYRRLLQDKGLPLPEAGFAATREALDQ